jgi:hypothetical protein
MPSLPFCIPSYLNVSLDIVLYLCLWFISIYISILSNGIQSSAKLRSGFGLHTYLTCNCRRIRVCCSSDGMGSYYQQGSGCQGHQPQDNSFTVQGPSRSESWCAGLSGGILAGPVERYPLTLAETQVQKLRVLQCRPLVHSECEDTGSVGLE